MNIHDPLYAAAHPEPLTQVTLYSAPLIIPVTGPVILNGAIARYGERLGVPTPYNSVLADIVSCVQDNYNNQYGMENG